MLLVVYLVTVIALPLALGAFVLFRRLPRSRSCPRCRTTTARVRSRTLAVAGWLLTGRSLVQRRWCLACGWHGVARVPGRRAAPPRPTHHRVPGGAARGAYAIADRLPAGSLGVRQIEVDGEAWRVRLQGWAEGDRWVGRLLFVGPGGRVCTDARTLEGPSIQAILGRALTIPDETLAGRLRRVIQ